MKNNDKIFKVSRESYGNNIVTYNGVTLVAKNKLDIGSTINFDWGNTSAGAEALSYAILTNVGSREIAHKYTKAYTRNVIARMQKDIWSLEAIEVVRWINENTHYSITESAFNTGSTNYVCHERRDEERRKEQRRVQREKDFLEEAQRRLDARAERRHDDRRSEDRRRPEELGSSEGTKISIEKEIQQKAQEKLNQIQAKYQQELEKYKTKISQQNTEIQHYKEQIKEYELLVDSFNENTLDRK